MRVLTAKNSVNLYDLFLKIKRFQIMGYRDKVDFRRQLVGRVSPVAVGENTELTAFNKADKFLLKILEIAWG